MLVYRSSTFSVSALQRWGAIALFALAPLHRSSATVLVALLQPCRKHDISDSSSIFHISAKRLSSYNNQPLVVWRSKNSSQYQ
eukprot:385182-Ditylum_brightwellii.AAC.1